MVIYMKKMFIYSFALLIINLVILGIFIAFHIVKTFTIFALLISILIDIIITEKLFHNILNKQKSYIYIILSFMTLITSIIFCLYQYYFNYWDILGIALVLIYTIFFCIVPYFIIALFYIIKYKIKK